MAFFLLKITISYSKVFFFFLKFYVPLLLFYLVFGGGVMKRGASNVKDEPMNSILLGEAKRLLGSSSKMQAIAVQQSAGFFFFDFVRAYRVKRVLLLKILYSSSCEKGCLENLEVRPFSSDD